MSDQLATYRGKRPSVANRIRKGEKVLQHALESNTKRFQNYKAMPGNENATVASAINGGNPYGNVLGHAMNALTSFTGEDETSCTDSSANTPRNIFAEMKDNCIFFKNQKVLLKNAYGNLIACAQRFKTILILNVHTCLSKRELSLKVFARVVNEKETTNKKNEHNQRYLN